MHRIILQEKLKRGRKKMGNNIAEIVFLLFLVMMMSSRVVGSEGISFDYYKESCPGVENIVREKLQSVSLLDPTTPAAMLRLMFHDCQVQGCDGSILLDPDNPGGGRTEMDSIKNFGVRKREVINQMKDMVEASCPLKVSCSDILILAAREAVAISGGPRIRVPLGRKDSEKPSNFRAAEASLPPGDIGVDGMLPLFARKGMSIEESVAIIGSHTLGVTHCLNLHNKNHRLSRSQQQQRSSSSGSQDHHQHAMTTPNFVCSLPLVGSTLENISFVFNDPTSVIFDNSYYVNSMSGNGVLRVDTEMPVDPRTAPFVQRFAIDQDSFFNAFSTAFVKLSSSNVLVGEELGFIGFSPPFLAPTTTGPIVLKGVNYASGGGGILNHTGKIFVGRINFDAQMDNFECTRQYIFNTIGESSAMALLNSALFSVTLGSNDFINNYLTPVVSKVEQKLVPPEVFVAAMISRYKLQLTRLYNMGGRKIVVVNVGPIGCIPFLREMDTSAGNACSPFPNQLAQMFNDQLRVLISELSATLDGSEFVYADVYRIVDDLIQNYTSYGIENPSSACCHVAGRFGGLIPCSPASKICVDRSKYVFWDPYHPTEAANIFIAKRLLDGDSIDIWPKNLRQLISSPSS
ncbi:OLC1v1020515C1 [Oldenlandia corymbosa var. corymbosa]|uniref:peroxidase n=1 Tax=Oldenlandia corymbosa var. corymbosa TaxID=529605 RepID=A0AAV1EGQ5_OLDCO|nr:OLC1v1020515C1 [Oldenlandia corymbosa var. corymbosa]